MPPLRRLLLGMAVLLLLSIAVTYYFFEVNNIAELEESIKEREAFLRERRESVRNYQEKVAFYKTKEGIEHLAREQYNLVGPEERVFLLQSPDVSRD